MFDIAGSVVFDGTVLRYIFFFFTSHKSIFMDFTLCTVDSDPGTVQGSLNSLVSA